MTKKYKFQIPEEFKHILAEWLLEYDGFTVEECFNTETRTAYKIVNPKQGRPTSFSLPTFIKDHFLTEIDDGPVSAEVYMINEYDISYQKSLENDFTFNWQDMIKTFKKGEKNDRKRTQPVINTLKDLSDFGGVPGWIRKKSTDALKQLEEQ